MFRICFFILSAFLLIIMPLMSFDFGITWDEWVHNEYGKEALKYYESFGRENKNVLPGMQILNSTNLYNYGVLFDLVTNGVYKYIPISGEYETRHFINALLGFMAMIFTGLLAKEIAGWRAGFLALLLMFLSPGFLGHSMNNPKDIPFASAYVFSLLYMVKFLKELPRPVFLTNLFAISGIALSISFRVGVIVLITYLLLFVLLKSSYQLFKKQFTRKDLLNTAKYTCIVVIAGYFAGLVFWPYGHQNPFINPFKALADASRFSLASHFEMLFDGKIIYASDIPWHYIIKWIWITTPLVVLSGFSIFAVCLYKRPKQFDLFSVTLVLYALFFPICYSIITKPVVYDSWRHFLFIYPSMAVLAVLGFEYLFVRLNKKVYHAVIYIFIMLLASEPLLWIVKNHPHEYTYFNPLTGGIDKASKNYETDYWGNSLRQGAEWICKKYKNKKLEKPLVIYTDGEIMSIAYYLLKDLDKKFIIDLQGGMNCDYAILISRHKINNPKYQGSWPPRGTVYKVKADNAVLCAVVKNVYKK